ncbi:MAG: hypothetical protein JWO71_445 [Candidatus Acidoferrum typicum]|nr:hypothetical protein [Candidatus Acidoferrum typicum]
MQSAAVGFRVHSGWAAAVVLCGPVDAPVVVDRRKIQLVKIFTYAYRQPYHTAEKMPRPDAIKFIRGVQSDAKRLALSSLRSLQADLAEGDFKIVRSALLLASARALPELEKILASHALIHTADGELFRDSLRAACDVCHLPVEGIREKELFAAASTTALRVQPAALKRRIAALGKTLGPPWSQDEKFAALAAWLTLAR